VHPAAESTTAKLIRRQDMGLVVLLLLLALVFGGVGLFVEGLKWVLIIALILFVAGALSGVRARGGRRL
jgi:hypothetical membrane protein